MGIGEVRIGFGVWGQSIVLGVDMVVSKLISMCYDQNANSHRSPIIGYSRVMPILLWVDSSNKVFFILRPSFINDQLYNYLSCRLILAMVSNTLVDIN